MATARRRWIFFVITLSIPVLVLGALEGGLRLAGYGKSMPLFIANPSHPDYILPRPDVLSRYFPEGGTPRVTMEANFFLADKPENGLRLFVAGGSTAAGFPYGLGASPAGMLERRLRQTFPKRHVEVVNTAMSAINTYLLLDFADEIIAQQPDGILIYTGHNEYLGIFGAGSAYRIGGQWLTRAYLTVAHLALVDMLQQLLGGMPEDAVSSSRTFMSQVASDTAIPLYSQRYYQGLSQFERNLAQIVDTYTSAGIPVFLSTIASNVRDQPPFASATTPDNASELYHEGHTLLADGQHMEARQTLTEAKDRDLLRFRAPSAMNDIIRTLSDTHSNVQLVDSHQALKARSQDGIVGNSLMLEHLHPNLPGYFILSDAFYQSLVTYFDAAPQHQIDTSLAWQQRPVTVAEEYNGYAQIQALKADFPFSATPQPVVLSSPADWQQSLGQAYFKKRINWLEMMQQLYAGYMKRNDSAKAAKVLRLMADALPHHALYNEQAGDNSYRRGDKADALFYYERALRAGAVSPHLSTRTTQLRQHLKR
ncbi:hypothetical protein [Alteromonas halophila]|uniref:SGNH hydrolase-type esterase domain-containing protein n=1 Tax=Alteromonas halophila TaxID=516698 RepID=A0A918JLH7_9ALTE|nr:hypothetical protein [Alteromonas halophila]GGW88111.1 hypothetical protein GCM10007391_22350 [Alteromonas halophila]